MTKPVDPRSKDFGDDNLQQPGQLASGINIDVAWERLHPRETRKAIQHLTLASGINIGSVSTLSLSI